MKSSLFLMTNYRSSNKAMNRDFVAAIQEKMTNAFILSPNTSFSQTLYPYNINSTATTMAGVGKRPQHWCKCISSNIMFIPSSAWNIFSIAFLILELNVSPIPKPVTPFCTTQPQTTKMIILNTGLPVLVGIKRNKNNDACDENLKPHVMNTTNHMTRD